MLPDIAGKWMTGNLSGMQNRPLSLPGKFPLAISKTPDYT